MEVFRRTALWLLLLFLALLAACSSRMNLSRSSTQLNVGVRAARGNLWREALFRFERAAQIDPNDAMAHNNLAVAYEGTGDFDKARAEYLEALRLDKANPYIQKNYSRFVEFTSKNKKRQRGADDKSAPGGVTAPTGSTAPVVPPPTQPDASKPNPPGTTPPDAAAPTPPSPPNSTSTAPDGGSR